MTVIAKVVSEIKTAISEKNGKEYVLIEIPIAEGYKKVVFLDKAEQALVKVTYNK